MLTSNLREQQKGEITGGKKNKSMCGIISDAKYLLISQVRISDLRRSFPLDFTRVISSGWLCLQGFKFYDSNLKILIVPYYFISTAVGRGRKFKGGRKGN